ncbi:hypothetical protein F4804DRAFT_319142 [Jackrogersella minutella]|nr:hypothetical protein F4804DRAFT_319142 [Jackrogersella minutella]
MPNQYPLSSSQYSLSNYRSTNPSSQCSSRNPTYLPIQSSVFPDQQPAPPNQRPVSSDQYSIHNEGSFSQLGPSSQSRSSRPVHRCEYPTRCSYCRRRGRLDVGLCISCNQPLDPKSARFCASHVQQEIEIRQNYREKRSEIGRCLTGKCTSPIDTTRGTRLCTYHAEQNAQRQRLRKAATSKATGATSTSASNASHRQAGSHKQDHGSHHSRGVGTSGHQDESNKYPAQSQSSYTTQAQPSYPPQQPAYYAPYSYPPQSRP